MKIKFNVEISQKDGFKENHLNFNGDVDISPEELKELFNTKEDANERPEPPITSEQDTNGESKARFTVAVNKNIANNGKTIYAVKVNTVKDNRTSKYILITESIVYENTMLVTPITIEDYNTIVHNSAQIYSTNVLEFVHGKKIKEV